MLDKPHISRRGDASARRPKSIPTQGPTPRGTARKRVASVPAATLKAAQGLFYDLRYLPGHERWVTNGVWLARATSVPRSAARFVPDRRDQVRQTIDDLTAMRREPVTVLPFRAGDDNACFSGKGGETVIQGSFVRLLHGLDVRRLRGQFSVARNGQNDRRTTHRPLAGFDEAGNLVVVVMPYLVARRNT